jgi:dipeptidyl-peptidase-4
MKKLLLIIFMSMCTLAQQKDFTIEDVVLNSYSKLAPSDMKAIQWMPTEAAYSFVEKEMDSFNLVKGFASSGKKEILLSLEKLNSLMSKLDLEGLSFFPQIIWIDDSNFIFQHNNYILKMSLKESTLEIINKVIADSEDISIAPNYKYVAFTKDYNLYLTLGINKSIQISNDGSYDFTYGKSVSRNEFGIDGGIFWSPKSNYVAYYKEDLKSVTDYPILDVNELPAKVENIKYPMAGGKSTEVSVGVFNIAEEKTVWLNTGEKSDMYFTGISWSPDEKYIYVTHLNRDQNHLKLFKYNASTGEPVAKLFEESDEKFIEPKNPLIFLPNSSERFLYFSQRDGWNHLYLYNSDGKLIRQITKGEWVVTDFLGFDKEGENIFVISTEENPTERHLYKVNLKTTEIIKLTKDSGVHSIQVHSSGFYFIDKFSNQKIPREIRVIDYKGNFTLIHKSENPLSEYRTGKTKLFSVKASDGTDLYCKMTLPVDFDSTKKYPVIFYVYGGPGVQLVFNNWEYGRYAFWAQKMAQNGYIVFTLDNRGSANRGKKFEQATFRKLGTIEVEDQMSGVKYLKTLSYVDSNRFGVFGWSFGGFMTTSLMLRTNNTFKVGVGGGAVIDWKYYEVMYTERYMDTPQTNPEGYSEASLLNYVDNLNGKLLLVHGTSDPTVVWQHTLLFAKKAMNLNKALDYYPYVGHQHGIGGKDNLHLYNKITNYFLENL